MIEINSYVIFKDNYATLKRTSRDDGSGEWIYMTESDLQVVNFDKVMKKYCADVGISFTREEMDYILVYNEEKNPPDNTEDRDKNHINDSESRCDIARILSEKGGKEFIRFGLNKFKGYCFKDVHTYTKNEFDEKFVKLQNTN